MEQAKLKSIASKPSEVRLLPYVNIKGEYTLSEFVLTGFFNQLVDEGTAQVVFQDGFIKTPADFINFLQEDRNLPAFAFIANKIVGVAWLNGVTRNHAFAHFALLKDIWGKHTDDVGNAFLNYWFALPNAEGGPLFNVILGFIPEHNRAANKFIERLGFKRCGVVPSILYNAIDDEYKPGVLSYVER